MARVAGLGRLGGERCTGEREWIDRGQCRAEKPGPRWDVSEGGWVGYEAVEEGEGIRGRCSQDCWSPNELSCCRRARQDQPSLHMPDRIRYGHAAMYDRALLGTTDGSRTTKRQKPGRKVAGGAAGGERPRQSQGRKGTNSPKRQQVGWSVVICR